MSAPGPPVACRSLLKKSEHDSSSSVQLVNNEIEGSRARKGEAKVRRNTRIPNL